MHKLAKPMGAWFYYDAYSTMAICRRNACDAKGSSPSDTLPLHIVVEQMNIKTELLKFGHYLASS